MKYKQIVFDVDGTLIDTEYAVLHSLQDTIKHMTGKNIEIEKLTFALGITGNDALTCLGVEDVSGALSLWDKNMKKYMDRVCIFDMIIDLLKQLDRAGYELGIVTSKTREEFANEFSIFGVDDYFKTVICADDTDEHKPNPAPLLKYIELTKCKNEDLLYIGDSEYDLKCAMKAGTDFALAGWGAKRMLNTLISFKTPLDAIKELVG